MYVYFKLKDEEIKQLTNDLNTKQKELEKLLFEYDLLNHKYIQIANDLKDIINNHGKINELDFLVRKLLIQQDKIMNDKDRIVIFKNK